MSADRPDSARRGTLRSPLAVTLLFLFVGLALALTANVYQSRRSDRLEQEMASIRQDAQHQIAELREAQSALLEQDLLRVDQLSGELQKARGEILQQAKSDLTRSSSTLAKSVEKRHQEVLSQLSDLKSDLREDTGAKLTQVSQELERTDLELKRIESDVSVASSESAVDPKESAKPVSDSSGQQAAPLGKKKQIWSKLNPFNRGKKKQDSAVGNLAQ
jgi:hypothetical protein